jgi:hypothetical protein
MFLLVRSFWFRLCGLYALTVVLVRLINLAAQGNSGPGSLAGSHR